jgi:phage host-nuclease inhibitor protein Gam
MAAMALCWRHGHAPPRTSPWEKLQNIVVNSYQPSTHNHQLNMTKRQKLEPCIISSRAALEAVVADVIKLKIEHTQAAAVMEQEIAEVQKRHQENLLGLGRQIEAREAGVFVYCQKNRAALFPEKKSLDLLLATIGFELTPPRVDKISGKDTFGKIGLRLENLDWGAAYVRYPDPEVNKEKILTDRAKLKPEQLEEAGLAIEQDENFFIRPKSDVLEQSVREAA